MMDEQQRRRMLNNTLALFSRCAKKMDLEFTPGPESAKPENKDIKKTKKETGKNG